jgi:hypothetical protein
MKPKRTVYRGISVSERFWKRVAKGNSDECWLWTGCLLDAHKMGYGQFTINGRGIVAHRYSWCLHFGEIPEGMLVCHKCDVPLCVNPLHLFLGNCKDNISDRVAKDRSHKPVGSSNHRAELSESDVLQIRKLEGNQARAITAAQFGVHINHIGAIIRREKWRHI